MDISPNMIFGIVIAVSYLFEAGRPWEGKNSFYPFL